MERASTLLITKEMQTKTMMRYYLTLIRMAILKRTNVVYKELMLERMWKKGNHPTLLVGM